MILTVTLNPSLDRTVELPAPLRRGAVQRADGARQDAGGKGVNISRALRASGVPTLAVLPGDPGDPLLAELAAAGIGWEERDFSLAELRQAREAFLTSATSFVKPITRIDGVAVGDGSVGPVVRRLFEIFARHVKGDLRNAA